MFYVLKNAEAEIETIVVAGLVVKAVIEQQYPSNFTLIPHTS